GEHYVIAQMMLEMGVTTAVGGNCGMQNQNLSYFKEVLDRLGGSPVNYIMLAGYNTFRYELGIGRYETASQEQREAIRKLLQRELNEGAYGISFGIEYDPGITTEEILFAIGVTEDPNLLVSAHYREDCLQDINPVQEMIEIAEKIPMKFQISHLSSCSAMGLMQESLDAINEAMKRNPKLNYDTYPYNAFSTHMGSAVFEDGCIEGWHKDYSDILLTDAPYKDIRCTKEIFEKVREEYPDMLAVAFVMNEEEIAAAIANPNGMVASDAIINNGNGHPRAAGTFPRVLGKYVREDKALPLIDAIRKMTLEPAKRMDLDQKGRIELGCDADLTIFNPDTIIDGATFSNLHIQPEGIEAVFIDGKLALKNKVTINNRLGKYIAYR
ncbi:amidohydrolase family protein, partial [Emergencia timonensis]